MRSSLVGVGLSLLWFGCAGLDDYDDRSPISEALEERTGSDIGPSREPGEAGLPEGVDLSDGVTEEEGVALALWNNAAFQEALEDLGFARADLIEAGLFKNPVLSVLFPLGPKQLEFAATFPLEALWLRWSRMEIAQLELDRISSLLVQDGLDLMRDTRRSHAEVIRGELEAELADRSAQIHEQIAEFFAARLRAADLKFPKSGSGPGVSGGCGARGMIPWLLPRCPARWT